MMRLLTFKYLVNACKFFYINANFLVEIYIMKKIGTSKIADGRK